MKWLEELKYKKSKLLEIYYTHKYPWFKGWYWCFPKGWFNAFGKFMLNDIDELLDMYGCAIKIYDLKEKYGELRMYFNCDYEVSYWDEEYSDEAIETLTHCQEMIEEIVDKYSHISRYICMVCGKLDTPMLDIGGYVAPICKECIDSGKINAIYSKCKIIGESKIPEKYTYNMNIEGKNILLTASVLDIVRRIRKG